MEIQNSEIIRELQLQTRQPTINGLPRTISNQIVPVIELNSKLIKRLNVSGIGAINSTTATILAAQPDKDVYIVGASLSMIKDATSTSTSTTISFTDENGASRDLLRVLGLTLTAQTYNESIGLSHSIRIKRNTAININNGTNVANISSYGIVYYFTDDAPNA